MVPFERLFSVLIFIHLGHLLRNQRMQATLKSLAKQLKAPFVALYNFGHAQRGRSASLSMSKLYERDQVNEQSLLLL